MKWPRAAVWAQRLWKADTSSAWKKVLNYLYLHLLIFICSRTAPRKTQSRPQTEYIMPIPLVPDGSRDKASFMAETRLFPFFCLLCSREHSPLLQWPRVLLDKPLLDQGPKKPLVPTVSGFVPQGTGKHLTAHRYVYIWSRCRGLPPAGN